MAAEWARFTLGAVMLLIGMAIFIIQMIGVFKFRYVLLRMHAAAMGDTLGITLSLLGLGIINGFNFTTLKMFLVVIFLWFSSPASSHLISRLEINTRSDEMKTETMIDLDRDDDDKEAD